MKKKLALVCMMGFFAQPVFAANNIDTLQSLAQSEFKLFSEDLGSALSYKAVTPAEPTGITGFDLGIEVTSTAMTNSQLWVQATGNSLDTMILPKLHIHKGLPFDIDFGAFYSAVPSTNITLYGGELRYAILDGGVAVPAIAIRGAMTQLSGVDQLDLSTSSLDISISKGFAMFTPYAGVGTVWVKSTPDATTTPLTEEKFQLAKTYGGININFGITNFAIEYDKTGEATSTSVKLGFRF
ncbi:MAG TPA: hypothetical protein VGD24_03490 [Gallionella sp.]